MTILGIMIGGALGSLARYATGVWLQGMTAGTPLGNFPLATLVVNVVGSFLLSLIATLGLQGLVSPALRLALGAGFVGALTTFSTFEMESDALFREGRTASLAYYVLGNLILGYLAILLGRALAARMSAGT